MYRTILAFWLAFVVNATCSFAQQPAATNSLKEVVIDSFAATHDGWSSDEVILQTGLNKKFIAACQQQLPEGKPADFNWTLLNLRKAGMLTVKSTRRASTNSPQSKSTAASAGPIGEMCARVVMDRQRVSIDRLLTDPKLRAEFDAAAKAIDPTADLYSIRKAAFRLRKTRQLKPELITRIADWGRQVTEYPATDLAGNLDQVPESPGIYLFRDASGYLYIGEAINLRKRLTKHLDESDRQALANYLKNRVEASLDEPTDARARDRKDRDPQPALPTEPTPGDVIIEVHTFADDARIKETAVRRAYESELIRSRQPRFNVRP